MPKLKNLTITVKEDVARWARIKAARENKSVSRLVGEMLQEQMMKERGYAAAMKAYLSVQPTRLSQDGRYPTREEMHARQRVR